MVDGKKVIQKTLSAKLALEMKLHKPDNLDLLKKELIKGKLGNFKIAKFPSLFDGMPLM